MHYINQSSKDVVILPHYHTSSRDSLRRKYGLDADGTDQSSQKTGNISLRSAYENFCAGIELASGDKKMRQVLPFLDGIDAYEQQSSSSSGSNDAGSSANTDVAQQETGGARPKVVKHDTNSPHLLYVWVSNSDLHLKVYEYSKDVTVKAELKERISGDATLEPEQSDVSRDRMSATGAQSGPLSASLTFFDQKAGGCLGCAFCNCIDLFDLCRLQAYRGGQSVAERQSVTQPVTPSSFGASSRAGSPGIDQEAGQAGEPLCSASRRKTTDTCDWAKEPLKEYCESSNGDGTQGCRERCSLDLYITFENVSAEDAS
ncbi:MAG: hypothetical protein OXC07_09315 [Kistimonas sp.]|nr:hypothetical protein [Kistimonas sp.]